MFFFTGRAIWPNAKVSDRSQPPLTLDLSVSEPAGSGSLHRLVRLPLCSPVRRRPPTTALLIARLVASVPQFQRTGAPFFRERDAAQRNTFVSADLSGTAGCQSRKSEHLRGETIP